MTPTPPANPAKAAADAYDPHLHHNPPHAITELAKTAYNNFQKETLIAPLIDKPVHTRKCDTCPNPATTLTTYAIYYGQALITTHTNLCNTCNPNRRTETP